MTSEPSAENIVVAPTAARGTAHATRGRRERVVSAPRERAKHLLKSTRTSRVTAATPASADDSAAAGGHLSAARVDAVAARLRDELAEERCARDAVREELRELRMDVNAALAAEDGGAGRAARLEAELREARAAEAAALDQAADADAERKAVARSARVSQRAAAVTVSERASDVAEGPHK